MSAEHAEHVAEVGARFEASTTDPATIAALVEIRDATQALAVLVADRTHEGREQSLALTALQEAWLWSAQALATAGIRLPEYRYVPVVIDDEQPNTTQEA